MLLVTLHASGVSGPRTSTSTVSTARGNRRLSSTRHSSRRESDTGILVRSRNGITQMVTLNHVNGVINIDRSSVSLKIR